MWKVKFADRAIWRTTLHPYSYIRKWVFPGRLCHFLISGGYFTVQGLISYVNFLILMGVLLVCISQDIRFPFARTRQNILRQTKPINWKHEQAKSFRKSRALSLRCTPSNFGCELFPTFLIFHQSARQEGGLTELHWEHGLYWTENSCNWFLSQFGGLRGSHYK